jgi:hypothetical protein
VRMALSKFGDAFGAHIVSLPPSLLGIGSS